MSLISDRMRELNEDMHKTKYGTGGGSWAPVVIGLVNASRWGGDVAIKSVLDYGCGKGFLKMVLDRDFSGQVKVWEYDPCVEGKKELPGPADLVMCTDVMEHVERDSLDGVLAHILSLTRVFCYLAINMTPSGKVLKDGSNAHQLQRSAFWWSVILKDKCLPFIPMPVHDRARYCAFLVSKVK